MINKMFTIHDTKAKAYLPPFFLPEEGMAIRTFSQCINSKEHQFGRSPADYNLFLIGTFDDTTATVSLANVQSLGNGVEFKISAQPDNLEVPNTPEVASNGTSDEEKPISNEAPVLTGAQSGNSA